MNHNYSRSDLDPTLSTADKLHVHFGAGRLGFGLVLPALESAGSPYVIVNRPSAVWGPVVERERETQQHVGVKVRGTLPRRSFLKWPSDARTVRVLSRDPRAETSALSPRKNLYAPGFCTRAPHSHRPRPPRDLSISPRDPSDPYAPPRPFGTSRRNFCRSSSPVALTTPTLAPPPRVTADQR